MIDLKTTNVQILALDKRIKLWNDLEMDCIGRISQHTYSFICGNGNSPYLGMDDYNMIDFEPDMIRGWGYSRAGYAHHHFNAFMAHHQMIKRAKTNQWPHFLMMEDDAYITERFEKVWKGVAPHIPEDWDMLYLGWWHGNEGDEWNDNIEKEWNEEKIASIIKWEQNIGGLHGVIIRDTMYDKLLNLAPNNPIDCQLNHMKDINRYIITPKIIHTKTTWSYCEGSEIKRNEL